MTVYPLYVRSFNKTLSLITTFYCSSSSEAFNKANAYIRQDNLFGVVLEDSFTGQQWEYIDKWNAL